MWGTSLRGHQPCIHFLSKDGGVSPIVASCPSSIKEGMNDPNQRVQSYTHQIIDGEDRYPQGHHPHHRGRESYRLLEPKMMVESSMDTLAPSRIFSHMIMGL